jgi:hypothetical protein
VLYYRYIVNHCLVWLFAVYEIVVLVRVGYLGQKCGASWGAISLG